MNTHTTKTRSCPRVIRDTAPSLLALLAMFALSACKEHADADAHHHEPPAAKADEHAGHDHGGPDHDGHDHGADAHAKDEHGKDDHGKDEHHNQHADEVKLTPDAIERYGVRVDTARAQTLRATIVTPARVGFNTEAMAHVGSPLRGRVVEISARLGQEVKKGDALCIIESPELAEEQAELFQKRVALESAGPAVELAKASWERSKALQEQTQGTSLAEVQRREAEYKSALASQRAATAAAIAVQNRLHLLGMSQEAIDELISTGRVVPRYTVHAPIDGQIIQREITQGELVGPDREALLVLADLSNVWVLADVPEAELLNLAVGAKVWVRVGASEAKPLDGQVSFVSPVVNMTTRTAQVRIEVPTGGAPIKPGMFAQVEIETSTGSAAPAPVVAIPDVAVQTVEGEASVFVPVDAEPNTFARRAVTVGKAVGGMVPVHAGLTAGEQVVVAGSFILKAELGKGSAGHDH